MNFDDEDRSYSESPQDYPEDTFTMFLKFSGGGTVFSIQPPGDKFPKFTVILRSLDASNKAKTSLKAYVDVDLLQAWAAAHLAGTRKDLFPDGLTVYGGSAREGVIESRSFMLGDSTKSPGLIAMLKSGPGVKGKNGAIMPQSGASMQNLWVKISPEESAKMAWRVLNA